MNGDEPAGSPRSNPYVGPRFFERKDREFYYGRDHEAFELLSLLTARRLVLFYAQSGAGKTSLINARLIPSLEKTQGGFEVLPIGRVGDSLMIDANIKNRFTFNLMMSLGIEAKPEQLAELNLTDFLLDLVYTEDGWIYVKDDLGWDAVPEDSTAEDSLAREIDVSDADVEEDDQITTRALIIDQFEEIFTLHPELEAERIDFFKQLAAAMQADPFLYVMISMREDYIAQISPYVQYMPDGFRTRYYMQRMRHNAALDAVRLPAKKMERAFSPDVPQKLVSYLRRVRTMPTGTAVTEAHLGPYIEPVQLQVVCLQLWQSVQAAPGETITMQNVNQVAEALTGKQTSKDPLAAFIDTALAGYYTQAIQAILDHPDVDVDEYELRDWFSEELIKPGGIRNLVPRGVEETEGMPDRVVRLLDEKHHLIRNDIRGGRPFVELIHDSFVKPILQANRQWRKERLRTFPWINAAFQYDKTKKTTLLLSGHRLREAQKQSTTNKDLPPEAIAFLKASDDQEQRKRRTKILYGIVGFLIIGLLIVLINFNSTRQTNTDLGHAVETANAANMTVRSAEGEAKSNLATATAALVKATVAQGEADNQRATAEAAEADAVEQRKIAEQQSYIAQSLRLSEQSKNFWEENRPRSSLLLAVAAYNQADLVAKSVAEQNEIQDIVLGTLLLALNSSQDTIFKTDPISIKSNGLFIFTPMGKELWTFAVSEEQPTPNKAPLQERGITITLAAISPGGDELVFIDSNGDISQTNVQNIQQITSTNLGDIGHNSKIPDENSTDVLAISPDGTHLAIASCPASKTTPSGSTETETNSTPEEAKECQIYLWEWKSNKQISLAAENCPLFTSSEKITSLTFLNNNSKIVWSSEPFNSDREHDGNSGVQTFFLGDFQDQSCAKKPIPLPQNHHVNTIAYLPGEGTNSTGLLVTAGAEGDLYGQISEDDFNQGSLQFWHVRPKDGSPNITQIGPPLLSDREIIDVQAITDPPTILTLDKEDNVTQYNANINEWPYIACQIANRNLNTEEWDMAFPTKSLDEALAGVCSPHNFDFGLHISFAEEKLLDAQRKLEKCTHGTRIEAHKLFKQAEDLAARSTETLNHNTDFLSWGTTILLHSLLNDSTQNLTRCLNQIDFLHEEFSKPPWDRETLENSIVQIRGLTDDLDASQANELDDTLLDRLEVVAKEIDTAGYAPEMITLFNNTLANLYAALCIDLRIEDSCLQLVNYVDQSIQFNQLAQTTTSERQMWQFEGEKDQAVIITMNTTDPNLDPYLNLMNTKGETLFWNNDSSGTSNSSIFALLPETGTYLVHASGFGPSFGAYDLTITSDISTINFDDEVQAEGDQFWKFSGDSDNIVSITMEPDNVELYPFIDLRDENGEILEASYWDGQTAQISSYFLPEDSSYYISTRGFYGTTGAYMLSLDTYMPQEINSEPVTGHTKDNIVWQFEGEIGDTVAIVMTPEDETFYPYWTLYNAAGEYLTQWYSDGPGSPAQNDEIVLMGTGLYYIIAESVSGEAGNYMLSVEKGNAIEINKINNEPVTGTTEKLAAWQFDGADNSFVAITMMPLDENLTPYLDIYSENGNWLDAGYSLGAGQPAQIGALGVPESGSFYIIARDQNGTIGEFTLAVEPIEAEEIGSEPEISTTLENPLWQFRGSAGDRVTIDLESSNTRFDPFLILIGPGNEELVFDDDSGEGPNSYDARIQNFELEEDGMYYIIAGRPSSDVEYTLTSQIR